MLFYPICKINIGLHVISKREDGFHVIETVMYPVRGLCDALEILPDSGNKITFTSSGLDMQTEVEHNICVKAYRVFCKTYPITGVKMHLHKMIPMGAGLGGGSADAAYVIRGLASLFDLQVSRQRMEELVARVGSDAPFFIANQPTLATGRGEILTPVACPLRGYRLVILKPDVSVGTAEAYAGITPQQPDHSLPELLQLPIHLWRDTIKNDFEKSVFSNYPLIGELKEALYRRGACYAAMSGSGSAVYGLFPETMPLDLSEFSKLFVYQEYIH